MKNQESTGKKAATADQAKQPPADAPASTSSDQGTEQATTSTQEQAVTTDQTKQAPAEQAPASTGSGRGHGAEQADTSTQGQPGTVSTSDGANTAAQDGPSSSSASDDPEPMNTSDTGAAIATQEQINAFVASTGGDLPRALPHACIAQSPDGTAVNRIYIATSHGLEEEMTRSEALRFVQSLDSDGFQDYRLPTEGEATAIAQSFTQLGDAPYIDEVPYWTSTDVGLEQARVFSLAGSKRTVSTSFLARVLAIRTEPLEA